MNLQRIFGFLNELQQNNNREWFRQNEAAYRQSVSLFEKFVQQLVIGINEFDPSIGHPEAKDCIFRIYRDVRFSHNKEPYKTNFGAYIAEGGKKSIKAGYYVHLQPGASFAGGGIYMPAPEILKAIRSEIYYNTEEFKRIMGAKEFTTYFSGIYGDKLKTCPKDFPKDFPDASLLVYKDYTVIHSFSDHEMFSENITDEILKVFRAQHPFNDFLNNALE
ncbi:MAG: DUF2461 domain-containing protein [Bacteroidales bacterium]|nr:DUF2461 domain-containing protein [Bacteroidales bacterium]HOY37989.1 DUF2461 domain-containing protein [Bacteroidales bacterium]HQP04750.1 DUF2461 domain-containing protein [Bacteroidales bacterium]